LGRIHNYYIHLGETERQRIRDARNERFLQEHQEEQGERRRRRVLPESILSRSVEDRNEVASAGTLGASPMASPVSLYYPQYHSPSVIPDHLRNMYLRDITPQNFHDIFEEIIVASQNQREAEVERRKTTVHLHMEPTKFGSKSTSDECPICYEPSDNMVMTKCDHLFCQPCMLKMIRLNCYDLSCALCRSSIKDVYVHSDESMDMMFHA